jgi:CheY-like chemotaxis protein
MVGERILIVEDDAIIAETLRCMLVDGGYGEPVVVASGEAGIDAVDSHPLSLVLMDIRLAGILDGITTAERIRTSSDLPVVFLTAYDEDSLLERAKLSVPYG